MGYDLYGKGNRTANERAAHFGVHPTLIGDRKKQLLAGGEPVFADGHRTDAAAAAGRHAADRSRVSLEGKLLPTRAGVSQLQGVVKTA